MFASELLYLPFLQFRRFNRLPVSSLRKPPLVFVLTPCIQELNKNLNFFYSTVYGAKFLCVALPYTAVTAIFQNLLEGCRCVFSVKS
jgi:hypothetical protein